MSDTKEKKTTQGTVSLETLIKLRSEHPGDRELVAKLLKQHADSQSNYTDPVEEAVPGKPDVSDEPAAQPPQPTVKKPSDAVTKKRPAPSSPADIPPPAKKPAPASALPKPAKTMVTAPPATNPPKPAPPAPAKPKASSKVEDPGQAGSSPYKPSKTTTAKRPAASAAKESNPKIDTSNSKVFVQTLFQSEDPAQALSQFLAADLASIDRRPRSNPRLTILTLLGELASKVSAAYGEVPGISNKVKTMLNEQTIMATRRMFYDAVVDRLGVNRPPFYVPNLDMAKNTPNFNDAAEILDQRPEAVKILLDQAMSQWYGKNNMLEPVLDALKEARGASLHATVPYSEDRFGQGLRCLMTNERLKPNDRSLCELQVMKAKGEITRFALEHKCRPIAAALITDRLRQFMMTEDVAAYLSVMNAEDNSENMAVAGSLAATSGLGIFMAARYLLRLVLAQLMLSTIAPRVRS